MKIRAHVVISGRVQGVFFRANTKQKADQLGLAGWVRNTSDGKVEALFEGEEKFVQEMINWCHRGPSSARVDDVEVKKENILSCEFNDFSIKY
ncbi:MAG: acylphosphatase [Candidatus Thermoplasmatota archaeon]|jgi:acylphosphatase|nr:acylphosphatase [Candidatus Thermoplasmatota archaeon]